MHAKTRTSILAVAAVLAVGLTGCGPQKDATYGDAKDLREAVVAAGVDCPGQRQGVQQGEHFLKCRDGLELLVAGEDGEVDRKIPLSLTLSDIPHVEGPNWVIAGDEESLVTIQEALGGEVVIP